MELNVNEHGIAEAVSADVIITEVGDALDLLADCRYRNAEALILHEHHLAPGFFELRTRLAGEVLQKFSQYSFRLAIVGDFGKFESRSLADFIRESNRQEHILFVATVDEARRRLSEKVR